jgi:hypothetical protein
VQPEREACIAARLEVAARLSGVERSALEKDVRRLRERRGVGQNLGEREVGTPPAAATARSDVSSVSRSRP